MVRETRTMAVRHEPWQWKSNQGDLQEEAEGAEGTIQSLCFLRQLLKGGLVPYVLLVPFVAIALASIRGHP